MTSPSVEALTYAIGPELTLHSTFCAAVRLPVVDVRNDPRRVQAEADASASEAAR